MARPDYFELDDFTKAYITAALWSSNDESTPQGGEPMDANYTHADISDETLAAMVEDCRKFQTDNAALLEKAYPLVKVSSDGTGAESHAGHDFFLTRNRHGSGYFDGDYPEYGGLLTEAAHKFGECNLYVGDDGKIYK